MKLFSRKDLVLEDRHLNDDGSVRWIHTVLPVEKISFSSCKSNRINFRGIKGLKYCFCGYIPELKFITNIPETLTTLNVRGCTALKEIDLASAAALQTLSCSGSGITKIQNIPPTLEGLMIDGCKEFVGVLDLATASGLKKLHCSFSGITKIQNIPPTLEELKIDGCEEFVGVLDLATASGLKKLNCDFSGIEAIQNIPPTLEELVIKGTQFEVLDLATARGLKKLDCTGAGITTIKNIPPTLEELSIANCDKFVGVLDLADTRGLKQLDCNHSKVAQITNFPPTLKTLNVEGCINLKTLDLNATEIEDFRCTSDIEIITHIPPTLKRLDLSGCKKLTTLDLTSAQGLTYIDLSGCDRLPNTPEFVACLEELELRNSGNPHFRLIWPEHLDRGRGKIIEVKNYLKEAYREYYKSNPDLKDQEPNIVDAAKYPVLVLFHRFLSESLVGRGGVGGVVNSALPVAKYIKENPEVLEFINEYAKGYLDACVNQPVAGFTEIALLVEIAKQTDVKSKLEVARIFMAVDLIRSEIKKLGVGSRVEVELANAMLNKVHSKLLADKVIDKPWPGVPKGIAYQTTIESYLNDKNINDISDKVKTLLKKPLADVVDYVCEGQLQDFWAYAMLGKEGIYEQKDPLRKLQDKFGKLEDQTSEEAVELSKKISIQDLECRKKILEISKEMTSKAIISPNPDLVVPKTHLPNHLSPSLGTTR